MEHQVLINALKKALKLKGVTYPKLAQLLEISEGSVGRIFSEGTFTLQRFVKICNLIGLSMEELLLLEEIEAPYKQFEYTLEQEHFFAQPENKNYIVFFDLLLEGRSPQEIGREFDLDEKMLVKLLSTVEKLGLIKWLPGNKAKILTSKMITYLKNGPIFKTYAKENLETFFDHSFNGDDEIFFGSYLQLSLSHRKKIISKMEELYKEIRKEIKVEDILNSKTTPCGIFFGLRPWSNEEFIVFDKSKLK